MIETHEQVDAMETPEEFRAKVWSVGVHWQVRFKDGYLKAKDTSRSVRGVFVSELAAYTFAARIRVIPSPREVELQSELEIAYASMKDLALFDETLTEIDRWEYRP